MSPKPSHSTWADDMSDDECDTTSLLRNNKPNTYQATQNVIRDHEEGLDRLGNAIKRQKYIANELATEVDLHNEIIDDIDSGLTSANENIRKNTRNIKLVTRKSSTFYLWFLIVLLGIVIVLLAIL